MVKKPHPLHHTRLNKILVKCLLNKEEFDKKYPRYRYKLENIQWRIDTTWEFVKEHNKVMKNILENDSDYQETRKNWIRFTYEEYGMLYKYICHLGDLPDKTPKSFILFCLEYYNRIIVDRKRVYADIVEKKARKFNI